VIRQVATGSSRSTRTNIVARFERPKFRYRLVVILDLAIPHRLTARRTPGVTNDRSVSGDELI
jgi:hypothetical protein